MRLLCARTINVTTSAAVVDDDFVGDEVVERRIRLIAQRMRGTMQNARAQQLERTRARLQSIGRCNCCRSVHKDTCSQSYWVRYNALVALDTEERVYKRTRGNEQMPLT